jgi:tol-pal system protein YbgF
MRRRKVHPASLTLLLLAPFLLGGCYGSALLREPVTVEETARDLEAVRQEQAALEKRLAALEARAAEQAELLRTIKAEASSRSEDLDQRLLAIDSKLHDALGPHAGFATNPPLWSANPSARSAVSPDSSRFPAGPGGSNESPAETNAAGSLPASAAGGKAASPGDSASAAQSPPPGDTENESKRVYDQAYLDLTRGNYSLAVLGFREFIRRSPASDLADNAQYWIGESFYMQRDFNQAIAEFLKVEELYPRGDRVPASLLKIGYSFLTLGDKGSARRYLNRVAEQFPNSEEAGLAKGKLRSIG